MEERSKMLLLSAAFLFQCLLLPAMSAPNFDDQKSFFPIPPIVSYTPPAPAKGSGSGHATPTPSGGSGSHGVKPPINCGTPPNGGHHSTSPSKGGSSGGHHSSRSPSHKTPISTPAPVVKNPPTTPVTPTPVVTTPASPPFSFGPVSPPFTCIYWKTHPTLIWGLIGWAGTVGAPVTGGTLTGTFGVPNLPGSTSKTDLLQALSNTRIDGYGDLYREGTAAFLNSLTPAKFPYTTAQVKVSFLAALSSNKAAADQARLFKRANEGSM